MLYKLLFSAALANGLGLGLGFVTHLSLASFLDVENYGLFSFVFSIAVMVSLFANLGFNASVQRFIPAIGADDSQRDINSLLVFAQSVVMLASLVVSAVVFILLYYFKPINTEPEFSVYGAGFVLAFILSVNRLQVGILKAFHQGFLAICFESVFREVLFLLIIWGGFLFGVMLLSASVNLWGYICVLISLVCIAQYVIAKKYTLSFDARFTRVEVIKWLRISMPIMMLAAAQMLMHRIDIMMLGFMVPMEDVGAYGFAAKISQGATLFFMAGITIFGPRASAFYHAGDVLSLKDLYKKTQKFMIFGGVLICFPMLLLYPYLLNFYQEYQGGLYSFFVLVGGYFLSAALGPASNVMIMTKYEMVTMWVTFGVVIANILLNILLVPMLGILGAAIATACALILRNFVCYLMFLYAQPFKS